jgi:integration host factor subunit beta
LTKADLVDKVTSLGDLTRRDGEIIVDLLFDSVIGALKANDKVEIRGFGSFRITELKRTDSEVIVETIFDNIIQALQKGDKIEIRGFGSFRTRQRNSRTGRNPKTGASVAVPAKRVPFFKPSKELRDLVNPKHKEHKDQKEHQEAEVPTPA